MNNSFLILFKLAVITLQAQFTRTNLFSLISSCDFNPKIYANI